MAQHGGRGCRTQPKAPSRQHDDGHGEAERPSEKAQRGEGQERQPRKHREAEAQKACAAKQLADFKLHIVVDRGRDLPEQQPRKRQDDGDEEQRQRQSEVEGDVGSDEDDDRAADTAKRGQAEIEGDSLADGGVAFGEPALDEGPPGVVVEIAGIAEVGRHHIVADRRRGDDQRVACLTHDPDQDVDDRKAVDGDEGEVARLQQEKAKFCAHPSPPRR